MTRLLEKKRMALRMLFRVLGLAAVAMIFSACYGPMMSPMPEDEHWNRPPTAEVEGESSENTGV